jgi:hypothetical protein
MIKEGFGTNTIERDPLDIILSPDTQRSGSLMFYQGSSGQIPTHWNNSPFLSGGRLTSAFGANPKGSKNRVLRYEEFVETTRKFSNK